MVEKPYPWKSGATLDEHSKRKHKILREYFSRYLAVRCQLPQQQRFRLAIVDGFSGAGRYAGGEAGSPIIFVEQLADAARVFNITRAAQGMAPLSIECLLLLNDEDQNVVAMLRENMQAPIAAARDGVGNLHIQVHFFSEEFEQLYPTLKELIERGRYRSVLFNLDQCGIKHVARATLTDIMASFASAEIFYTFMIESLLAFLQKSNPDALVSQLGFLGFGLGDLNSLIGAMSNREWLGAAEKLVFNSFRECAAFVSPFSINNPDGWRYWLIHFANSYRARQEYNDILHDNSSMQAHFGRSGLNMLSYDPRDVGNALYLFDVSARESAMRQLLEDIPRLVTEYGDAVRLSDFYQSIYNMTPAHTDDVHAAMIENPDMAVITETGGERRKANTIAASDVLRMKQQRSFFPIFLSPEKDDKAK